MFGGRAVSYAKEITLGALRNGGLLRDVRYPSSEVEGQSLLCIAILLGGMPGCTQDWFHTHRNHSRWLRRNGGLL